MKKASFSIFVAIAGFVSASLSANQASPQAAEVVTGAQTTATIEQAKQTTENMQVVAANEPNMMSGNCDSLSADQQSFASQLNATNKMLFCSKFSAAQRASAMQMSGTTGANGMKMTPDQAVEQTSRGNAPVQKSGGGCPVR